LAGQLQEKEEEQQVSILFIFKMKLKARYSGVKGRVLNYLYKYEDYEGLPAENPKPEKKAKIRFFRIEKHEDLDKALEELKDGKVVAMLDIRLLKEKSFAHLRYVKDKILRASKTGMLEMRFYTEDWILVIPSINVKFYKDRKEKVTCHGNV
jgi:SepF-like predicted cell division protein (DUF552 family)